MTGAREPTTLRNAALLAVPAVAGLLVIGVVLRRQPASVEEHRVQAAISEYNLALERAYATQRPELLDGVASEDERERVELLIMRLAHRGERLDARQERLAFESISVRVPKPEEAGEPAEQEEGPPRPAAPPSQPVTALEGAFVPTAERFPPPAPAPYDPADHQGLVPEADSRSPQQVRADRFAAAMCNETWWHRRVDPDTGDERAPPTRTAYRMKYELLHVDGRWIVDRLEMLGTRKLPPGE